MRPVADGRKIGEMKMKRLAIVAIALMIVASGIMANTIWIPIVRTAPASNVWTVIQNLGIRWIPEVGANRQVLMFENGALQIRGYCIDVGDDVPRVGKQCEFYGNLWHCGSNFQRFAPWDDISTATPTWTPLPWTPTPSPTATFTPSPTPTNTPVPTATNTPIPCTFECPANTQRVEYPTMQFSFGFLEAPEWGTYPHRVSMVYPNEARITTTWAIPYQALNTDIRCGSTIYDVPKCDDGSCSIGCADFGYSQSECQVETSLTFYACNVWVVCQGRWNLIDPWAEEARLMVERGEADDLEEAHEILAEVKP